MPAAWPMWVNANSTATTGPNAIWSTWNDTGTAAWTASNVVWYQWATTASATTTYMTDGANIWTGWQPAVEETKRQRTARLKREQVQREAYELRRAEQAVRDAELRAEKEAAVAKAEVLLREHLTTVQRDDYDRLKTFLVEAQSGRVYRIRKGWTGNVELLDDADQPVMRFCIHPSVECPDQDNMLAQKLLLETDEESFNKIANKTQLRVPVAT